MPWVTFKCWCDLVTIFAGFRLFISQLYKAGCCISSITQKILRKQEYLHCGIQRLVTHLLISVRDIKASMEQSRSNLAIPHFAWYNFNFYIPKRAKFADGVLSGKYSPLPDKERDETTDAKEDQVNDALYMLIQSIARWLLTASHRSSLSLDKTDHVIQNRTIVISKRLGKYSAAVHLDFKE